MSEHAATKHHNRAMRFTDRAIDARRQGDAVAAKVLFRKAYWSERRAAEAFADRLDFEPTRSILYRSAAVLAADSGYPEEAERLCRVALAGSPPACVAAELRDLLREVGCSA